MPISLRAAVLAAMTLLVGVPDARAQDPLDRHAGKTVTSIRLLVEENPVISPALLSLVDVREGQPLSVAAVRSSEQRLSQLPQYEDVTVTADEAPGGGIILTFRLEPRHPVDSLEFTGETGLTPSDLSQRVRDHFGGLPTGDRLDDVEQVVREILAEEGYRSADVRVERALRHDPDRATLVFKIKAGPRLTIQSVQVNGRSPYTVPEVLDRAGVAVGGPYRERDLATRLADLRSDLSAKGYYAAIVQQIADVTDASVSLTLVVEAGPIVTLQVEPGGALPGDVDVYIPIKREGTVDDDLLDDARAGILTALQRRGYAQAEVRYSRETPTPERMVITFTINRGRRHRIDRVEAPTGLNISAAELVKLLGIEPRDVYDPRSLATGVGRITSAYRERGFFEAEVVAEPKELPERATNDEAWDVVTLSIKEGPQATIKEISFDLGEAPRVPATALRSVLRSATGSPYVEAIALADHRALIEEYSRRGFREATVQIERRFSEDRRGVTLAVTAREGAQLIVRQITVVGNSRLQTDEVLREMTLQVGQPWSDEARFESRRRLLATSSYRNVTITPEQRLRGETDVRVVVAVEEASATTTAYGGGVEVGTRPRSVEGGGLDDQIEISPRAFFEISRRNLGGRNRSINWFSRLSLKPTNAPGDPERDGKGFGFAEYRVSATYRDQNAFRTDSDLLFGVSSEQAVRTSFNFIRRAANAELLHRVNPSVTLSGRYGLEFNRLFEERFPAEQQSLIDRVFPQVRLSLFSGGIFWDRRDSPLSPSRGTLVVADHELAARQIGSEVGFVKSFYQLSFFRPLSADRRTVLATRAQFGVARGFERRVTRVDGQGQPIGGPDGTPVVDVIADLPASHRFFAGGSTTVHGFQLDRLGFLRVQSPDGSSNGGVLNDDGLSNGGNGLVVLNAEVRTIVGRLFGRSFALAGFLDGGNVFDRAGAIDLGRLRGAAGFGMRYDSPLGPIRLDFGFKMNRLVFNGRRERGWEYHLSIGEAF